MSHFDITKAQPTAWSILSRSFQAGRVASTYLFCGHEGVGHWPLAITFAALMNCEHPVQTDDPEQPVQPCRQCRNCRMVFGLNFEGLYIAVPVPPSPRKKFEDIIEFTNEVVEAKREDPFHRIVSTASTTLPIDMAREIASHLSRKPTVGITRVVLFYQMEKMRVASADALLKLIEEPPPGTVLILTTERPEMLLPTIQSRSQIIRLTRIPEPMIEEYLVSTYEISEKRARLVSRLSEGVMSKAVELAGEEDDETISRRAVAMLLFKSLFKESGAGVISRELDMVNTNNRDEVRDLLLMWQSLIRDCHYFAATGAEEGLTNVDFIPEIKQLSSYFSNLALAGALVDHIKNTLADFARNVHIQTALAALTLKLQMSVKAAG